MKTIKLPNIHKLAILFFSYVCMIGLSTKINAQTISEIVPENNNKTMITPSNSIPRANSIPNAKNTREFKKESDDITNTAPKKSSMKNHCEFMGYDRVPWLDKAHNALSTGVCNQAVRIDRFFGNLSYHDNYPSSFWRVRNTFSLIDKEKVALEFNPKIKAKIHLPNMKKKLNLVISDDEEDSQLSTQDSSNKITPININEKKVENVSTKIQWTSHKKKGRTNKFDIGLRYKHGLRPFVRDTLDFAYMLNEKSTLNLYQSIFWKDEEGYGETSEVVIERLTQITNLIRFSYSATFSENSLGIDLFNQLTYYIPIDDFRIVSFSLYSLSHTHPSYFTENTGFGIRYRKRAYSDWLFLEFEPEITWPEERDRNPTSAFHFRIEAQFGS